MRGRLRRKKICISVLLSNLSAFAQATNPRRAALRVVGICIIALAISACQALGQPSSNAAKAQGRIAWPKDGDLWVYDLDSKQQTRITNLPQGAAVTGASWSPDGQRVVYAQFWRRPNERSSGSDLMIANKDGSQARIFAERDAANTVLEAPLYMPSGRVYYDIRRVSNGRETLSIVRQVDGGQPETLVDNAYNPGVSQDESTMVYIRSTRAGQTLFKKKLDEPGDGCELISDQVFQYLSQPRISPDGKQIALGGSGEASLAAPSGCGGDPRSHPSALGLDPVAWLAPGVAYAHGLPADLYSLNLDGSDLKRVADIKDDDPTVAYSPDGSKLAIFGVAALYLVDVKGGPTEKLVDQGGYGGLDWTR
jgi:Tol biopolymer transport system component